MSTYEFPDMKHFEHRIRTNCLTRKIIVMLGEPHEEAGKNHKSLYFKKYRGWEVKGKLKKEGLYNSVTVLIYENNIHIPSKIFLVHSFFCLPGNFTIKVDPLFG